MARPIKEGLDYFPLDVEIDDKLELVEAKYELVGFGIFVKLLMKIYKEGYFYHWSEREQLLFSKRVNVDINLLNEVVNDCINWGLFDNNLYTKHGILTSIGIQRRYFEAVSRRKELTLIQEYLLFDIPTLKRKYKFVIRLVDATNNLINVYINSIDTDISTQSKGKESKGKNPADDYCEHFVDMNEDTDVIDQGYREIADWFTGKTGHTSLYMTNAEASRIHLREFISRIGTKRMIDASNEVLRRKFASKNSRPPMSINYFFPTWEDLAKEVESEEEQRHQQIDKLLDYLSTARISLNRYIEERDHFNAEEQKQRISDLKKRLSEIGAEVEDLEIDAIEIVRGEPVRPAKEIIAEFKSNLNKTKSLSC